MTTTDIRAPSVVSTLQADVGDPAEDPFVDDQGPWTVSGVAVGEDNVLHMSDGKGVLFTRDVLAAAADTQVGEPVTVDHPTDATGENAYPPPTDATVGKVTAADHVPGRGLVYEATIHDPEIARGIHAGSYEVSVHPTFTLDAQDSQTGAYLPANVEFKDLSVVSRGDSPDNTASIGPSRELAAWVTTTDLSDELEAAANPDPSPSVRESIRELATHVGLLDAADVDAAIEDAADAAATEDAAGDGGDTESNDNQDADAASPSDEEAESSTTDSDDPDATADPASQSMPNDPTPNESQRTDQDEEPTDEEPEPEPEPDPDEPAPDDDDEEEAVENAVTVDIGEHDSFDAFLESKLEEMTAQQTKAELVDEIITASAAFDEEDREDLLAAPQSVVETTFRRETDARGATLPQQTGTRAQVTADVYDGSGDDEDSDIPTGTGVSE